MKLVVLFNLLVKMFSKCTELVSNSFSFVCLFLQESNVLIAANSQGTIKVCVQSVFMLCFFTTLGKFEKFSGAGYKDLAFNCVCRQSFI